MVRPGTRGPRGIRSLGAGWLRASWFRRSTLVVLAAVLVGAILRVVGAWWGLPYSLHSDEWVIVQGAIDLAQRNSFEPSLFLRPDHVEIKLSFLAYTLYAVGLHGLPVEVAYASDPGTFLLISRLITAAMGTAMIVLAALIGRRFSRSVGAIAAVLFALFPPFIMHSYFATPDIPLALASMALVLALMYYVAKPGYSSLLAASAAVSFSIAIKYPGAISAVMIAIVVIVLAIRDRRPWRILSHGATAVAGVLGFLFLISPVLFTNITGVMDSIRQESRTEHSGADGLGWGGNLAFYVNDFAGAAGLLLVLFAIVGIAFAIRMRSLIALPLTLGIVMWVALSAVALHWARWGIPMYITPLLFASVGGWYLYRFAGQRWPGSRWRTPVAVVVSVIVLLNFATGAAATVARYLAPDTRVTSMQEFADLGVTRETAIFEGYSPLSPGDPFYIFDQFRWDGDTLVPLDPQKEFVLLSSCIFDRYETAPKYAEQRATHDAIRAQFEEVLRVDAVPRRGDVPVEPLSIISAIGETAQFAAGGMAGCGLEVYRITP